MELDDIHAGMRLEPTTQPSLGAVIVKVVGDGWIEFDLSDRPNGTCGGYPIARTGHYALATDGRVDFEPVREGA